MLEGTRVARLRAGVLMLLACALALPGEPPAAKAADGPLSQEEIKEALRTVLRNGAKSAVAKLGKEDGFLKDQAVKIALPAHLEPTDPEERTAKADLAAARFVRLLNRAAETAVAGTGEILAEAVAELALGDAREILKGPADAAAQYFKRTSSESLEKRLLPLVKQAALDVGAADAYRVLAKRAALGVGKRPAAGSFDPNLYITQKTLDGLFVKIAEEEKRIREDPASRTSEALKKVFGAAAK
ncbi:MAG: DUF4197 domain-containing protein [Planctomycetota bacterium]